ncbi:TPA: fimbrial protein [Escherichia coli]|uniref:fimbrial protein n=1 Tax=Escherichia coli TaxID=562 RepID=UPI0005AA9E77|nr:fimbrial protein [Escherichia coli]ANV95035.1 fimbrial protein [Escherichia coli]EGF4359967.1 fimbrial protein [Escherichia coli]EJJ5989429.1 fimbrial protein [Escherichia coli]ELN3637570.1 fimbrial protein [Escherichia coli]MCN1979088.1 fimbrial protein [Escherichia coli]
MKKIRGLCLPVMLGAVLMSQHVHAVDNLTFRGKLIIPACTVQNAEVNWGDIEIQKLVQSGGNQKDFTVDMNCPYSLGTMKVTITSNGQTGNSILVPNTSTSSSDGLLIYLYDRNKNGSIGNAITLGTPFSPGNVSGQLPARNISLYAKLGYKGNMQSLKAGNFSATATLVASYS